MIAKYLTDAIPVSSESEVISIKSGMQPSFIDQPTPDAAHDFPILKPAPHRHHRTKGDDPTIIKSSLRGKPRARFLVDIPHHEYRLPGDRPINATIVDLIVLLPQWFRNTAVTWRFLNNGINSAVHYAILEQHRHLGLTNAEEAERARDHISDTYRKTMRKLEKFAGWTKAKHSIPDFWDKMNISVSGYTPEASKEIGYIAPPSIPFKDLAVGLKKLPQGYDAGDLTRALSFAMQNQKFDETGQQMEFMFPDDIQLILSHIRPTQITQDHVDGAVVDRYFQVIRSADGARRRQISEQRRQQQAADDAAVKSIDQSQRHEMPSCENSSGGCDINISLLEDVSSASSTQLQMQPRASFPTSNHGYNGMPLEGMGVLRPTTFYDSLMTLNSFRDVSQGSAYDQPQDLGYRRSAMNDAGYSNPSTSHLFQSTSQEAAATIASQLIAQGAEKAYVDFPDIPDICTFETGDQESPFLLEKWSYLDPQRDTENMDALVAAYQTYDLNGFPNPVPYSSQSYHPSTLLRDCPEGLNPNDHSDLARASQSAQQ